MIKTIIFDFAGVISTNALHGWRRISERFNLAPEVVKENYYKNVDAFGRGGKDSVDNFIAAVCPGIDRKEFESLYVNWWTINERVIEIVRNLKDRYKLYLLSDNFDPSVQSMREEPLIAGLFEKMYFSNETGHIKKDPDTYELLRQDIGFVPEETIMIDDKESSLVEARKLGINTILFKSTEQFESDLRDLGVRV